MSDVNDIKDAPDDFALLGFDREFQIDPVRLDDAVARVSNEIIASAGNDAGRLRERLQLARERLGDPVRRARYLLELLAGSAESDVGDVPDSLKALEQQAASASDPVAISAVRSALLNERQSRLNHVATIFTFPRNIPNPASQWSRDSVLRSELRAMDFIDRVLAQLTSRVQ